MKIETWWEQELGIREINKWGGKIKMRWNLKIWGGNELGDVEKAMGEVEIKKWVRN